uniref:translocation/assembly module TamB domain-containing protein n=1 Tax=Nafulsella turpanensis TaxID=1265690 RepID=UPI000344E6A7|nr:translocation/assembly module TamB domain-containing protein [Nafulsella turpanensis]
MLAYILLGIFSLLLLVIVLIQVPAVQTYITKQVTQGFEEQWGTEVSVGSVNLKFFETATIEDIYLEDQAGDTLIYAEYLKADIGLFALFDQSVILNEIVLENAYINLYQHVDSSRFNYEYIVESFATPDTAAVDTASGGFTFDLEQLLLVDVRFNFIDDSAKTELRARVPYWLTEIETLGLEEGHIRINNSKIRELELLFRQAPLAVASAADTSAGDTDPLDPAPGVPPIDTVATQAGVKLDSAWLNPSGFRYSIGAFAIEDSQIRYSASEEAEEGTLNFENVALADMNLLMEDFYLAGDTLTAQLETLHFTEKLSGFQLQDVAFNISIEESLVAATLERLVTEHSKLNDAVAIEGFDMEAGDDMLAQLQVKANIEEAVISMKDAAYFTDALDTLPNLREQDLLLTLEMAVEGDEAVVDQLELKAEEGLYLNATATAQNIDNLEQMHFDVNLRELTTNIDYLKSLSLGEMIPAGASKAGNITLVAQAEGTLDDVDLDARLKSGLGTFETDILYKKPTENGYVMAGNFSASEFDLSNFLGDSSGFGNVSFKSKVKVKEENGSLDIPNLSLLVSELEFNNYTYEGLAVEGKFIDSLLTIAAAYEDPFLVFDVLAVSDLKDSLPLVEAELDLDKINMLRLNLMADSIILSTKLYTKVQGQTLDDIRGMLSMRETEIIRGANLYTMDSLLLTSTELPNGDRSIELLTEFMEARVTGNYLFEELPLAIDQCVNYYCSAYKIDETIIPPKQAIELEFAMKDEPAILKAFMPELELTAPLVMTASLENDRRSFNLDLKAPSIVYDSLLIKDLDIEATTVERVLSYNVNASLIQAGEAIDIPKFQLEGQWEQDSVHFDLALAPPTDSTYLALGGAVTFVSDTIILELDNTDLAVYGQDYFLADDAIFKYAEDYIFVDDFVLQHEEARLSIYTEGAGTAEPRLITEINDFEIADFATLAGMESYGLAAELDGIITITDVARLAAIEANLVVEDILIDSVRTGDLAIDINKVADNGRLNMDIALEGPGNQLLVEGYYNIEDSTNAVALDVNIDQLRLSPWQPFVQEFITSLSGSLEGEIMVRGTAAEPAVEGVISFGREAALQLAATGVRYKVGDEDIEINAESIVFDRFTIVDSLREEMVIEGVIHHQYFTDYILDLEILADNFQLVGKARSLEDPIFGSLFVSTRLSATGPIGEVVIDGNLKVNDNTDLGLVLLTEEQTIATPDYITFVNRNAFLENDTVSIPPDSLRDTERLVDVEGFTLRANVEVTPASRFTVIVDPNTGDYLEVAGAAELLIRMNPLSGLNLQGTYTVEEGAYYLSFLEVIQKSFEIKEGSTVDFDGDPLDAELDITAIYETEVSRYPLIEDLGMTGSEVAAAKRREPVHVLLNMLGTLEEPEFTFNIVVPESDYNMSSIVEQQLAQIRQDETRLFKQVFGLIVLNRFIGDTPAIGGAGGGGATAAINSRVDQSLSAFLSEQLNALTQDYLGVSIDVDIDSRQNMEGQDASLTAKDVDLQVGRSFFDDRVEVKVGGTTSVGEDGTAVASEQGGPDFAGNFTILYHITENGNLNLKIFQRNERTLFTDKLVQQTGVSLSYQKAFNEFGEFIGRAVPLRQKLLESEGAIQIDLPPEEEEEEGELPEEDEEPVEEGDALKEEDEAPAE